MLKCCRLKLSRQCRRQTYQIFSAPMTVVESTTPVVFVGGENATHEIFQGLMQPMADHGYSNYLVQCPLLNEKSSDNLSRLDANESIDELVKQLHNEIRHMQIVPPLLVTHSLSGYLALKYLESHSLAGLVLVNPINFSPHGNIEQLIQVTDAQNQAGAMHTLKILASFGEKINVDFESNIADILPVHVILAQDCLLSEAERRQLLTFLGEQCTVSQLPLAVSHPDFPQALAKTLLSWMMDKF